jgi:hypothetical protein
MRAADGGGAKPVVAASASASASSGTTTSPSTAASGETGVAQLADADGGVTLTYAAGAEVRPGNGSKVLWLDGTANAYATSAAPVVDTTHGFTVSAWVVLKRATGASMVISQGDGGYYTFALGRDYWPGHEGWVFKVQTAKGNSDDTTRAAYSPGEAKLNTWVLLTGTYDAVHHTIDLYVDGKLAGRSPAVGIWRNGGALQLGRIRYKNVWGNNWDGAIAHVQVWNAPLTPAQVAAAVHDKAGVATEHSWLVG